MKIPPPPPNAETHLLLCTPITPAGAMDMWTGTGIQSFVHMGLSVLLLTVPDVHKTFHPAFFFSTH